MSMGTEYTSNYDVSDFLEWIDNEIPKEIKDGELTKLGKAMVKIKGLVIERLEKENDKKDRSDV